ncbi:sensor histidine kinase [Halobellus salinisoli]|uniref:sensor histidine kinase n=1 Tax=Halobellus salinisoli TaxID=3108500 RepID=UPI0030099120
MICGTAGVDLFERLPVLTVCTTIGDNGTQTIDDCNTRFARRLDYAREDLIGKPATAVYAPGATPPTLDPNPERNADAWECEQTDGCDATTNEDGSETTTDESDASGATGPLAPRGRDHRNSTDSRRSEPQPENERDHGFTRAFTAHECVSEADTDDGDNPAGSVCTLVGVDGHLIQTVAEAVPRADEADGQVIFHIDVTRRQRREQQAEVLNRLMRHNVRNDLNLLRGHANVLKKHGDDEVADSAAVLDRIADRWLGLAETVRNIERLFDEVPTKTAELSEVIASTRRTVEGEWTEGRVEAACEVDSSMRVSERLHVALVELCENGIKHNDDPATGDGPVVHIEVTPSHVPDWVEIRVVDEGPGIPPQELTALHAEEETPLQHGSGLGFWLVRFVVRRLGGEIAAENRDGDGSRVSIHVPLAADV